MPPNPVKVENRVKEFKNEGMEVMGTNMLCSYCNCRVDFTKHDTVVKHISSAKHVKAKEAALKMGKRQQTISGAMNTAKKLKEDKHSFNVDTVEAFVCENIPVEKLDNPVMRKWLNTYIKGGGDLPLARTLREEYIPLVAKDHEEKIKKNLAEKDVMIYSDEATDKGGRCVFNVLMQTLEPAAEQELYLASSTVLDAANSSNCANAILDTLNRYEKNLQEVAAFNADSARYMTKCFKILQGLHEELLQIQCWPHKLHHVGNTYQNSLPQLNLAVSKVKKVFLNSRKRKASYQIFLQEKYPDDPAMCKLFPMPIITRWNSWKESVDYLHIHFDDILEFLGGQPDEDDFEDTPEEGTTSTEKDSKSIKWLKELTHDERIQIKVHAEFVSLKGQETQDLIKLLQSQSIPTGHLVYGKLDVIERKMAVLITDSAGYDDLPYLSSLPTRQKSMYLQDLKEAAKKFRAHLVKLCASDPAKKFFLGLEALLSPRSLALPQLPADHVKTHMKNIPFVKLLSTQTFMAGQAALMDLVKDAMKKPDFSKVDVLELLCALKSSHLEFANASIKALWILPSNANSERSIAGYNIVVTDRRRRLKPENSERLTIVYFNSAQLANVAYLSTRQRKGDQKGILKVLTKLLRKASTTAIEGKELVLIVLALRASMAVKLDNLIIFFDGTTSIDQVEASERLTESPAVVVLGEDPFVEQRCYVAAEKKVLSFQSMTLYGALHALFQSYFAFKIEYDLHVAPILEFIQRHLHNITVEKQSRIGRNRLPSGKWGHASPDLSPKYVSLVSAFTKWKQRHDVSD